MSVFPRWLGATSFRKFAAAAIAPFVIVAFSACGQSVPKGEAAQPHAMAGNFATLAMTTYTGGGSLVGYGLKGLQANVTSTLTSEGWNSVEDLQDSTVHVSSLTTAAAYADALFVFGHGNTGSIVFTDDHYWGPGCVSQSSMNGCFSSNLSGTPLQGRLQWMFLFTSDTVAPPVRYDSNDPDTTGSYIVPTGSWEQVFGTSSSSQSLRGIYGYWMAPAYSTYACSWAGSDPNRVCDVTTNVDAAVEPDLIGKLWSSQGSTNAYDVKDAWISANQDQTSLQAPNIWSIVEDCQATDDTFMGPDSNNINTPGLTNRAMGHNICFESPYTGFTTNSHPSVPITSTSFVLQPMQLAPRPVNVAGLIQRAQATYPGSSVRLVNNGPVVTYESSEGHIVNDYAGYSGGDTFDAHRPDNPIEFSELDAQNAAVSFIQNTFTMPADAALSSVVPVYQLMPAAKSRVLVGYQFTWRHSSGTILGGDAISVDVYDSHVVTRHCEAWTVVNGGYRFQHPVRVCTSWQITTSDSPVVPYAYYLWREPTSTAQRFTEGGRRTGGRSIDAYTASTSLPTSRGVVGYTEGYWTGGLRSPDQIAHPAWFFHLNNGNVAIVDAFTGRYLGSSLP